MNVPFEAVELAETIALKAYGKGLYKGRSSIVLAASSLYAACRLMKIPLTVKEVVEAVGEVFPYQFPYNLVQSEKWRRRVKRLYRRLVETLRLRMPMMEPAGFIGKTCSKLSLSEEVKEKAVELVERAKKRKPTWMVGKAPTVLAAAAVYTASIQTRRPIPQREIAEALGITEVALRSRYLDLVKILGLKLWRW